MDKTNHQNHNKESEKQITQDVQKYGFHLALIEQDNYLPAFVYTIGFHKTYNHPELIIFGLPPEVMGQLLHNIGEEIKNGKTFLPNVDYHEIVTNHPVRFIEVDKAHYKDYLGYCTWFNGRDTDYKTYQLVWTDKEGKFPWEPGFFEKWKFKQPILDRNTDFKFYEERNLAVYTTQATLDGKPILSVYHNKDGSWQFHSEEKPDIENSKLVSLESLVKKDPSLNDIYYLGFGQAAVRRDGDSGWEVYSEEEE